jgi:predicted RND superfamily exporter protein
VLLFALRSIRIGLLSLVPNLAPALAAFGFWGLVYGKINMALATVAGMALGIVVDDTIHFLSKYLHARRGLALAPEASVRYAIEEVGGAVIATSLALIAGFLALTPSPFVLNWGMGLMTAITLFFAMILDLTMLPGLLIAIDKEDRRGEMALALSRA